MFIPKHGVIYCSNNCLKYNKSSSSGCSSGNSSLQRNQQQQANANQIVNTYLNTPQIKLNLIQQQQKQQSPLCSPGPGGFLGGESPAGSIDQQLANALSNQSRSRKPFTYPVGSEYVDVQQQQHLLIQQQQQSPKNPQLLKVC